MRPSASCCGANCSAPGLRSRSRRKSGSAACCSNSPFTSAAAVASAAYPFVPVRLLMRDQFRSDERIGAVTAPTLVLHGAQDRVVPFAHGERLYALIRAPKRLVRLAGADHNDHDQHGGLEACAASSTASRCERSSYISSVIVRCSAQFSP